MHGMTCTTVDRTIGTIQSFNINMFLFLTFTPVVVTRKAKRNSLIAKKNQIAGRTTHQGTKTRTSDRLIFQSSSDLEAFCKHVSQQTASQDNANVIRTGLRSRGLVNLTGETAVCSLLIAVQTHSIQYLQVLPSDEINACSGFENWSRNMIDGSCVDKLSIL